MILFGILATIVGIALIFAVVIQNSKGGGLSSTFAGGSATQMLGARRSAEAIEKITWYLAGGVAVLAFVANVIGASGSDQQTRLRMTDQIENQQVFDNQIQDLSNFQETEGAATEAEPAPAEGE